jgi:hypothetical protein
MSLFYLLLSQSTTRIGVPSAANVSFHRCLTHIIFPHNSTHGDKIVDHLSLLKQLINMWTHVKYIYRYHNIASIYSTGLHRPPLWINVKGITPHLNEHKLGIRAKPIRSNWSAGACGTYRQSFVPQVSSTELGQADGVLEQPGVAVQSVEPGLNLKLFDVDPVNTGGASAHDGIKQEL